MCTCVCVYIYTYIRVDVGPGQMLVALLACCVIMLVPITNCHYLPPRTLATCFSYSNACTRSGRRANGSGSAGQLTWVANTFYCCCRSLSGCAGFVYSFWHGAYKRIAGGGVCGTCVGVSARMCVVVTPPCWGLCWLCFWEQNLQKHTRKICMVYMHYALERRKHTCIIYIYIHTHARTHAHTYLYVCTYIHIYVSTYMHVFILTYVHIYMYTCIHTYIHSYIYPCVHTYWCQYIHKYIHTHIHTYIHTYIHNIHTNLLQIWIYIYVYTWVHMYLYKYWYFLTHHECFRHIKKHKWKQRGKII